MTRDELAAMPLMHIFEIPLEDKATQALGHEVAAERYLRLVGNGLGKFRFMEAKGVRPKLPIGRPRSYTWTAVEALEVGQSADVELSDAETALQHVRNQATRIRRRTGAVFSVSASTKPKHATVRRVA